MKTFESQGNAEDFVLFHRYRYYVLHAPELSDSAYDAIERAVRDRWSVGIAHEVGSSLPGDYPVYVREGRRPNYLERQERDQEIRRRWIEGL